MPECRSGFTTRHYIICFTCTFTYLSMSIPGGTQVKVNGMGIYCRLCSTTLSVVRCITQCYLQITPYLRYLVHIHQLAPPPSVVADSGGGRLIAAYYSFVDPERMIG